MEFYVKQPVCKNHLFSPYCFTDGHEAESTFGMVKRRFAPWRLYSSAECTSLQLTKLSILFYGVAGQNYYYLILTENASESTKSEICILISK